MISLVELLKEAKISTNYEDIEKYASKLRKTIEYLKNKDKILLLSTSNRWSGHKEDIPKSKKLAKIIHDRLGKDKCNLIDVNELKIHICEGNVSSMFGNHCGTRDSLLKDKEKNPSNFHRCWASINNKDDELWKISKPLIESDVVLFFTSIRWGQTNTTYQKLIERLTWLENRHTTLGESNILKNKESGIITIGQNWNGSNVIKTQKKVLGFYGFNVPSELSWSWQYTDNENDETKTSYKQSIKTFNKILKNED